MSLSALVSVLSFQYVFLSLKILFNVFLFSSSYSFLFFSHSFLFFSVLSFSNLFSDPCYVLFLSFHWFIFWYFLFHFQICYSLFFLFLTLCSFCVSLLFYFYSVCSIFVILQILSRLSIHFFFLMLLYLFSLNTFFGKDSMVLLFSLVFYFSSLFLFPLFFFTVLSAFYQFTSFHIL